MTIMQKQFGFDEGPDFIGYTDGTDWNGWGKPRFTKEVMLQVVEYLSNESSPVTYNGVEYPSHIWYDPALDVVVVVEEVDPSYTEATFIPRCMMNIGGEECVPLYDFGGLGYCWNESDMEVSIVLPSNPTVFDLLNALKQLDPSKPLMLLDLARSDCDLHAPTELYQTEAGVALHYTYGAD